MELRSGKIVLNSKFTIKNLPDEILLKIFKYLNKKAIEEASEVCQRWHDLILGSKNLTDRLTFFFGQDYCYEKLSKRLLDLQKFPYRNFVFYPTRYNILIIWKIQDILIEGVEKPLKIHCVFGKDDTWTEIVEASASTLTHLCLSFFSFPKFEPHLKFPNLISLSLYYCACLTSLAAPKLKELLYTGEKDTPQVLGEFLCKFDELKKLTLSIIPIVDENSVKFQLKELNFKRYKIEMEPLKAFLMTQQKSLKELKIEDEESNQPTKGNCQELLNFVVQNMKLEELSVFINCKGESQQEDIEDVNDSIKKLYLGLEDDQTTITADYLIPILKKFRGVENLSFYSTDNLEKVFKEIDMSNLQELRIGFGYYCSFDCFKFAQFKLEKLTKLAVNSIANSTEVTMLVKITSFCPNLKILNIEEINLYEDDDPDIFQKSHFKTLFEYSKILEDFVIDYCYSLRDKFMHDIMAVKSNLKRLKVKVKNDDDIPKIYEKMKNAKFVCDISDINDDTLSGPLEWNRLNYDSD